MKLNADPITVTLKAYDRHDAEIIRFMYEEYVEELPEIFGDDGWLRTLRLPVELYLIFPNKRKYGKFMRELASALTTVEIVAKY